MTTCSLVLVTVISRILLPPSKESPSSSENWYLRNNLNDGTTQKTVFQKLLDIAFLSELSRHAWQSLLLPTQYEIYLLQGTRCTRCSRPQTEPSLWWTPMIWTSCWQRGTCHEHLFYGTQFQGHCTAPAWGSTSYATPWRRDPPLRSTNPTVRQTPSEIE